LDTLIAQLSQNQPLTDAQARDAVACLTSEQTTAETKADFLAALNRKGETPAEITAFALALRELSVQPMIDEALRDDILLDVVGTGGDRMNTFNISTATALLTAAGGVRVAKHGNRAITSQTGSADVLEALGIRIDLGPQEAGRFLLEHGFVFFFAPNYHPAFRHIAPARKLCAARGQRTIFNLLGPLLNPARPNAQLMGVPRPELCEPLAHVLQSLGVLRAMVVCGTAPQADQPPAFMDELSVLGENSIAEFYSENGFATSQFAASMLPVGPATLEDLRGGDRAGNAALIRRLFSGEERGPRREAVLLNAAAALFVADRVRSLDAGWELAERLLDDGRATAKLNELVEASRRGN
jgi:anthranilate phosphoribosyltransferase